MYDHYLSIVLSALTVLILGCWNPVMLQVTRNGVPTGYPNYMWLALFALLVGLISCYLISMNKKGLKLKLE
jgi:hypothetical protein